MLTPRKTLAVLFDLDGTLVDTAPDLVGTLNMLLRSHGLPERCTTSIRHEVSNGSPGLIAASFGLRPGDQGFAELKAQFLSHYADNLSVESQLFPHIDTLLSRLDEQRVPWGIVTNKPVRMARDLIRDLGLRPHTLLGGDSSPRAKPAADALELACAHMRVTPQRCLYIGDAPRDISAGQKAGMPTIAAGFGYIPPNTNIGDWNADHIAQQPQDLWAHIQPYLEPLHA